MSNLAKTTQEENEPETKGPNLVLLYTLLAFAILSAMAIAAMIVWPFYKHGIVR